MLEAVCFPETLVSAFMFTGLNLKANIDIFTDVKTSDVNKFSLQP
jgi:hypothetical protein